jgi:hypothetical protein
MRFFYWREESQTIETTLWFTMQQAWNMHADMHADFLFVRPGLGTKAYCRVVVRDALFNIQQRREQYVDVTRVASSLLWPEQPFQLPRGWLTMSSEQREHWLDVEWPHMQRLELLGDGITPEPAVDRSRLYPGESQRHLMQDCSRWHKRVKAARSARQLHARAQIAAVLERAALGLFSRLDNSRDVLDDVLQHAAAGMCAEHGLDPRTLLELAHM